MDINKIKEEVKALTKGLLEEKSAATLDSDKVEKLLAEAASTVESLSKDLETKSAELAQAAVDSEALRSRVSELEQLALSLNEKLDALKQEAESNLGRAVEAEGQLAEIAAQKLAADRMAELADALVAFSGEKAASQCRKVKGMSAEEFAAYKQELLDIRAEFAAALKVEETPAEQKEEVASEADPVETVDVPPADVEMGLKDTASVLANIELVRPDNSVTEDYKKLGDALANKFKNSR